MKRNNKKLDFMDVVVITIIAIGLAVVITLLFGALVAYEAMTLFNATLDTAIIVGLIAGAIGGIAVAWHFIEDFGA